MYPGNEEFDVPERKPEAVPSGAITATHPDPGSWSLMWVPIVICVALLLFVAVLPSAGANRVVEPSGGFSSCQPAAPDDAAPADPRC